MGVQTVRIRYRGPGSLEQLAVAPPKPEIVQTARTYGIGAELTHLRPGWYVHEITVEHGGTLTLVVERRPPE
jgi:hypothetical protein